MSNHLQLWVMEQKDCNQHENKAPCIERDCIAIEIVPFLFDVHTDVKCPNSSLIKGRI